MKKIVSLAIACMLLLSCFAINAFAEVTTFDVVASAPDADGIFSLAFITPVQAQNVKLTFSYPAAKMTLLDANKQVVTAETFTMDVNCELDKQSSKKLGDGQCQAYAYRSDPNIWAYPGDTVFTLYFQLVDGATFSADECPFGFLSDKSSYYGGLTVMGSTSSITYRINKGTAEVNWDWANLIAEEKSDFDATVSGTTITCIGKVPATSTNYGVEFTAESTVKGARAQKFYGAMNGDTVAANKEATSTKTFTFGAWDGTFQIILEGVQAGAKELNFFVNDTVIKDTNFTLTVE